MSQTKSDTHQQLFQQNVPGSAHVTLSAQLPTLAPHPGAPTGGQPTQQIAQHATLSQLTTQAGQPTQHTLISAGGQQLQQVGQPLTAGQFQVIQQPFGNTGAQFTAVPQFATYNQQGQLVLQPAFSLPGMQAAGQQQGQQQFILTAGMPQKAVQQTQQMIAVSSSNNNGVNKSISQNTTFAPTGHIFSMSGGAGGPQTFMIANPIPGGGPIMATGPQTICTSVGASQIKAESNKVGQPGLQHHLLPQQPQPMILPPGMTYMSPTPGQTIFQNGQIILRAPVPPEAAQQIMFSPNGSAIHQQASTPTALPSASQLQAATLQPVTIPTPLSAAPMRANLSASSVSNQFQIGKTQVSRNLAPILPTVISNSMLKTSSSNQMPNLVPVNQISIPLSMPQPASSPKTKQKMSPKGSGQVQSAKMSSANRSLINKAETGIPKLPTLGPPVLLSPQLPVTSSQSPVSSGPPTLKPMMYISSADLPKLPSFPPPTSNISQISLAENSPNESNEQSASEDVKQKGISNEGETEGSSSSTTGGGGTTITPKAFVKPNILTHVIDGHIIQESSLPFPVENGPEKASNRIAIRKLEKLTTTSSNATTRCAVNTTSSTKSVNGNISASNTVPIVAKSTITGILGNANSVNGLAVPTQNGVALQPHATLEKKRGPGRTPGGTKQLEKQKITITPGSKADVMNSGQQTKVSTPPPKRLKPDPTENVRIHSNGDKLPTGEHPLRWSVKQVCDFVKNVSGGSDYADDFALQEIDGMALMLLKSEHLMTAMSIKLGPALKICDSISQVREQWKLN